MYDGDKLVAEMDEQGAITSVVSWGAAGLFAYGGVQYQFDLQGNVVARTSAGDQMLSTHWFDAHGTEQTTPSTEPFGYKGRYGYYTDRESGLVLCTHRYLDPEAGRWLTRDPISYAGGVNLYSYCGNGPVLTPDPSGLFWWIIAVPFAMLLLAGCAPQGSPLPTPPDAGEQPHYGGGASPHRPYDPPYEHDAPAYRNMPMNQSTGEPDWETPPDE